MTATFVIGPLKHWISEAVGWLCFIVIGLGSCECAPSLVPAVSACPTRGASPAYMQQKWHGANFDACGFAWRYCL